MFYILQQCSVCVTKKEHRTLEQIIILLLSTSPRRMGTWASLRQPGHVELRNVASEFDSNVFPFNIYLSGQFVYYESSFRSNQLNILLLLSTDTISVLCHEESTSAEKESSKESELQELRELIRPQQQRRISDVIFRKWRRVLSGV